MSATDRLYLDCESAFREVLVHHRLWLEQRLAAATRGAELLERKLAALRRASSWLAGLSLALPVVVDVAAYVLNGLAPLVSWLEPLQKFSPFYQYAGHDPLRNGLSGIGVLVAVETLGALVVLAVAGFRRRGVAA